MDAEEETSSSVFIFEELVGKLWKQEAVFRGQEVLSKMANGQEGPGD